MANKESGNYWRKRKSVAWIQSVNKCAHCGITDTDFDIDHIIPKFLTGDKLRTRDLWGMSNERLTKALKECQLLCKPCHRIKSGYETRIRRALLRLISEKDNG